MRLGNQAKGISLERILNNRGTLKRLARVEYGGFGPLERIDDFAKLHWDELAAKYAEEISAGSLYLTLTDFEGFIPLEGVIDFAAERSRLGKELEKIAKDMAGIDGRLNNPGFVAKAPPEVLEESRDRKAELEARQAKIGEALRRLG